MATATAPELKTMHTLPGDAVRQIQWRFADRFDLQMLVQSARSVARGTVARMVAAGERNTHEWTPAKREMMEAFDRAGITAAFMDPEEGGFIAGPKNLALALAAFELAWVDGGAATASLASFLALAPIHECGTPEQVRHYKSLAAPPQPGEDRKPWRGAFALTEPIPYVGVDTGVLSGKVTIASWNDGEEPMLQVDKRGRFITNIAGLPGDPLVDFVLKDSEANVLCPATKLWNTGNGANMMREAVSLMGGYGITEDCPGFLANKWMDAQLEATYEGPEAVQRRQLTVTMTNGVFLAQFRNWINSMREIASVNPGTGACTLASAMEMWLWTLTHLQRATDPDGGLLYHGQRQGVTFALADALCWLVASRCQILDVLELEARHVFRTGNHARLRRQYRLREREMRALRRLPVELRPKQHRISRWRRWTSLRGELTWRCINQTNISSKEYSCHMHCKS